MTSVDNTFGGGESGGRESKPVASLAAHLTEIKILYGHPEWREKNTSVERYRIMLEALKSWIDGLFTPRQTESLIAWIVDSDNMIPILPMKSLILIDTSQVKPNEAGIYAFKNNGSLTFRRILPRLDGNVDVLNENPSYGSYNCHPAVLVSGPSSVVGRVVFVGNKI